jgi:hypothetical protein
MLKLRHRLSLAVIISLTLTSGWAQSTLTQIRDTVYNTDGSPFSGTVVLTLNGVTSATGAITPLSSSATIYTGALSVLLAPSTTQGANAYYTASYSSSDGLTVWTETWIVPVSSSPLSLSQVRQSGSGSGGSGGSGGSTGGSGGGSNNYATLPIAITDVSGLSGDLGSINGTIAGLTNSINGVGTSVAANNSSLASVSSTVTGLTTTVNALSTTVSNLSATVGGFGSGSGNVVFIDAEAPSGAINGTNPTFTLAHTPSPAASLELYRNGLVQSSGVDYTLSGTSVVFSATSLPQTGDIVQAFYRTPGSSSSSPMFADSEIPSGSIDGSNLAFTLAFAPSSVASLRLYKNGMLLFQGGDYTLSGNTVTFASAAIAPRAGDSLTAFYRH